MEQGRSLDQMKPVEILRSLRQRGVRVWPENGELRYSAPPGVVTQVEVEALKRHKGQLLTFLQSVSHSQPSVDVGTHSGSRRAPLTFAQWAHCRESELATRPSARTIASATRLRGDLNLDVLRESLSELVKRHEALRTRLLLSAQEQIVDDAKSVNFEIVRTNATVENLQIQRFIEESILEPVDVSVGPNFRARLLRINADMSVLVLATEHGISDNVSAGIILRDLFLIYEGLLTKKVPSLPDLKWQFADYAMEQSLLFGKSPDETRAYWTRRLQGCPRVKFFSESAEGTSEDPTWRAIATCIKSPSRPELAKWCRNRRTTPTLVALTAYSAAMLRWCSERSIVLHYQSDGRDDPRFTDAVGFFARPLYLKLEAAEDDTYIDFMTRVTDEYCSAQNALDMSFFKALNPPPEFTFNTAFNWIPARPQGPLSGLLGTDIELELGQVEFDNPAVNVLRAPMEPFILLSDTREELKGLLYFSKRTVAESSARQFVESFQNTLRMMFLAPNTRIR